MAQFKAINKNVEVDGETVVSIIDAMEIVQDIETKILSDNGIKNPKTGEWYLQQNWLDAFKAISDNVGERTLFMIGQKIPKNAKFPPEIDSIEKALAGIDIAYHMNHRLDGELLFDPDSGNLKAGIGNYKYDKASNNSADITCDGPYPCDFDKGIITAMAKKFKPSSSSAVLVSHDDKSSCRKKGDKVCVYKVKW